MQSQWGLWDEFGKPQPMYHVALGYNDPTGNGDITTNQTVIANIYNMEQESNYAFSEITVPDMAGGAKLVGHQFQSKIYVMKNELEAMMVTLDALKGKRVFAEYYLGWPDDKLELTTMQYRDRRRMSFGITQSGYEPLPSERSYNNKLSFSYTIESVPERPRVIISLSGCVDVHPEMFQSLNF